MLHRFAYQTVTVYGRTFQIVPLTMHATTAWSYNPDNAVTLSVWALPRSLATTGGIIVYFLFLQVLRCFSSLRSPPALSRISFLQNDGLSHSEIRGSKVICTYPQLIAAYHVLHRLREPRHPPCALSYLSYRFTTCVARSVYTFSLYLNFFVAVVKLLLLSHHVKDRYSGE